MSKKPPNSGGGPRGKSNKAWIDFSRELRREHDEREQQRHINNTAIVPANQPINRSVAAAPPDLAMQIMRQHQQQMFTRSLMCCPPFAIVPFNPHGQVQMVSIYS